MGKTKRYALTGGPGSGKSSILRALEYDWGEGVIREAAEDVIALMKAQGDPAPWEREDFQDRILELQWKREEDAEKMAKNGRIFVDRGLLDGLAYYQLQGRRPSEGMKAVQRYMKNVRPYEKAFLVENLGNCEKTGIRREEMSEALELEKLQEQNYREAGCEVIKIPSTTLAERVDKVMRSLK